MRHIYLNMKNFVKVIFFNLLLLVIIYSCSKDPSDAIETVPAEPIASQYAIENDSIIDFLQTHFYNYEDFVKLSSNETTELIIDTISGDNADKIPYLIRSLPWLSILLTKMMISFLTIYTM